MYDKAPPLPLASAGVEVPAGQREGGASAMRLLIVQDAALMISVLPLSAGVLLFLPGFGSLLGELCQATARGFEPLRAEPSGFLVHHLSHSVTLSMCKLEQACRARHVLMIGL